jgi:undecaprenyl-diphosphatase
VLHPQEVMPLRSLDTGLLLFINQGMVNSAFDVLMPALSRQGYLLVIPFILAMLARGTVQRDAKGKSYLATALWTVLLACTAAYLAGWVEDAVKVAVARERPCRAIENVRLLLPCPKSFSMPSGHAISSFAFALPLFYLSRGYIATWGRFYPLVLAPLIAFSRLYLGVHYPTDVLAGSLLGAAIGLALSYAYRLVTTEEIIQPKKGN